ncbi:MAG: inositol monophosphatase [Puniceicoccaceae bacterium]
MDKAQRHRVNAARVAIRNQMGFFDEWHGQVASDWKADETRVTFADFAITEKLFAELRRSFPEDQFMSEETVIPDEEVAIESRYLWVLDPIDGTNNYALGMPSCAISLALFKDGLPLYGLIYDGSTSELLEGGPQQPLLVNGRKVVPLEQAFPKRSGLVALHFPLPESRVGDLHELFHKYRVRSLGSAALHLAYVALGRLDGALDEKVRIWDIAAAMCLLEAAGREIRFIGRNPLPLLQFSMKEAPLQYYAGNAAFLKEMENWLR